MRTTTRPRFDSRTALCWGAYALSGVLLCGAALAWNARGAGFQESQEQDLSALAPTLVDGTGASGQAQSRFLEDVAPWTDFAPDAAASGQAFDLLDRAAQASERGSFRAQVESSAVWGAETVEARGTLARAPRSMVLNWSGGPAQGSEVGWTNNWLWLRSPAPASAVAPESGAAGAAVPYAEVEERPDALQSRRLAALRLNYTARVVEGANRNPVVEVTPLPGRSGPSRRFFVRASDGLVERVESFDHALRPISRVDLRALEPGIVSASIFANGPALVAEARSMPWRGEDMSPARALELQQQGHILPMAARVPAGFALESVGLMRCTDDPRVAPVSTFARYSDGLNVLTVFARPWQERADAQSSIHCEFGQGTMVLADRDSSQLVAIADLPVEALQEVLDSVRLEALDR